MKRLLFSLFLTMICLSLISQNQDVVTATLTSASRLFGEKDDLSSVILVIPKDSKVEIIGSDSAYYKVYFEDDEGFILKRHAVIDRQTTQQRAPQPQMQPTSVQVNNQVGENLRQTSRYSYLENKYGASMASRLDARKIWKGMSAEMVRDSWGTPDIIERDINGNAVKEEWVYRNTRLYIENNTLKDWGQAKR